jgi:hypothetical protein
MHLSARLVAVAIFCVAALSLRLQFDAGAVLMNHPPAAQTLWAMAGYFTILTNLGVAVAMMAVAWKWHMPAGFAAGMTLSIVVVAIVYHLVLARLWNPQGLGYWADQGLHSVVPALTVLWWVYFAPKDVGLKDLPQWLIWPAAYALYALVRGWLTGVYPYPFLDAGGIGWPRTALNAAGLVAGFTALGIGLIRLARRLPR